MPSSHIVPSNVSGKKKKKNNKFSSLFKTFKKPNKNKDNGKKMLKRFLFHFPSTKNVFNLEMNMDDYEGEEESFIERVESEPKPKPKSESNSYRKTSFGKGLNGQCMQVIPLLSNNGKISSLVTCDGSKVNIDVLRRKYVIICCVVVPALTGSDPAFYSPTMIAAYSELKLSGHKVEMVLVAKMHRGFSQDEAAFNHFFSAFPCLAIPFSEVDTRDYVCSYLGFNHDISTTIVDPTGFVLDHRMGHHNFSCYGSEGFPFRDSTLKAIDTQDEVMRFRLDPFYEKGYGTVPKDVMEDPLLRKPLSLHEDILQCSPHRVLSRFGSGNGPDGCLSVSDLSEKYVGLYLCADGEFMAQLHKAHQHCITNNQQLEIVLVCVALFDIPKCYKQDLTRAMLRYNIKSWFIFDDSKACYRLWRVFGSQWDEDRLIILPPNCQSGDLEGKAIINQLGIDAYPFTRTTILEQRLSTLRTLTPASWFKGEKRTCLRCNGRKSHVLPSEIAGRKLLLYLDWLDLSDDGGELCLLLMNHYTKIQENGWKVVFIPLDSRDKGPPHAYISKMPWLIMPVSAAVKNAVIDKLFLPGEDRRNEIIALSRKRRILSRQVGERLKKGDEFYKSRFNDNLREEVDAFLTESFI